MSFFFFFRRRRRRGGQTKPWTVKTSPMIRFDVSEEASSISARIGYPKSGFRVFSEHIAEAIWTRLFLFCCGTLRIFFLQNWQKNEENVLFNSPETHVLADSGYSKIQFRVPPDPSVEMPTASNLCSARWANLDQIACVFSHSWPFSTNIDSFQRAKKNFKNKIPENGGRPCNNASQNEHHLQNF